MASHNESAQEEGGYHIPVMLMEAVDALAIKPGGVYVDATLGGGGHSREILKRLDSKSKLIVFDQDADAAANLPNDDRILFVPQNFKHVQRFLRLHDVLAIDGLLADLGVSSHQFDVAERGFSYRFDAPLDMRMDRRQTLTAAAIVNEYSEQQLHKLFEKYGEVSNAKTLAKTIVQQRAINKLATINGLKQAVQQVVMGHPAKYFAKFFQALRIAVNDELGALQQLLSQLPAILNSGGRAAIITFHSLEDRMVKNFFKLGDSEVDEENDLFGRKKESPFTVITKKPISPGAAECLQNSRARSARLRIAEKK
jgi:16S rRNA (cytosine1402-N4)-methyltransferase